MVVSMIFRAFLDFMDKIIAFAGYSYSVFQGQSLPSYSLLNDSMAVVK